MTDTGAESVAHTISEIRHSLKHHPLMDRPEVLYGPWIAKLEALAAELDALQSRIENAEQAMSETQPSWEYRCHAIMAALGTNYGGPTPDIPEEHTWYARNLKRAQDHAYTLQTENAALRARAAEVERLEKLSEEAVAKCVTLHSRAVSAEAKVREQALDYLALDGQAIEALAEVERLREALLEVSQSLDWHAHGCCRGWSENLLAPVDALELARAALDKDK